MKAKIKTTVELLADGWTWDISDPKHPKLSRKGCWSIDFHGGAQLGLGQEVQLKQVAYPCPRGFRWEDSQGNPWSEKTWASAEQQPARSMARNAQPAIRCTCDIRQLMDEGCKCGGFKAEQAAKRRA